MSTFAAIIDNGKTSAEGFYKAIYELLVEGIPTVTDSTNLQAVQRGAGANMSVDISIGAAFIANSINTYGYNVWQDALTNLAIGASSPSNPRIDVVVAYINLAAVSIVNSNNPGALAFIDVQGTPGASPVAPNAAAIQTAVGAGVPWVAIANVTVPQSATQIVTANIADVRPPFAIRARLWGGASNTFGHVVPNIADDTVALLNAAQTLKNKTIDSTNSIVTNGWQTPSMGFTYSANNGNREFVLTPSSDPTAILSPGARFKVTRNTAAPSQSMAYASGSSQYATLASPSSISFSTAFTCEGWVFLQSYTGQIQAVIGRTDNSTGGFMLYVNANGQAVVQYNNATQFTQFQSVQSIPLNRWVHLAGVVTSVSGKTGLMYIDGNSVPVTSPTATAATMVQTGNLSIGALGAGIASTFLNGFVSEARVWSVAQSAASIQSNMGITIVAQANLVAAFPGSGNFNDASGNSNNLTATNGAIATQASNPYNTTEYAIVTKVTAGAVTLFCGNSNTIPNMTLNSPQYSLERAPYGFPAGEDNWTVTFLLLSIISASAGTASTVYNPGGINLNIPTGSWDLQGDLSASMNPTGTALDLSLGISSGISSFSDADLETRLFQSGLGAGSTSIVRVRVEKRIILTAQTPYYLLLYNSATSTSPAAYRGVVGSNTNEHTKVVAKCAYV